MTEYESFQFESVEDLKIFVEKAFKDKGVQFKSENNYDAFSVLEIRFVCAKKDLGNIEGQVVLKKELDTNEFQYALTFGDAALNSIKKMSRNAMQKSKASSKSLWGKDAYSIAQSLKELTMADKIQMALRCGLQERNLLMKESLSIWPYLLKNPKITMREVGRMAQTPQITSECLLYICKQADWVRHAGLKLSLVKNPKLPSKFVQKFMPTLNDMVVIRLAKSNSVKESVAKEARRVLAGKGKSVN